MLRLVSRRLKSIVDEMLSDGSSSFPPLGLVPCLAPVSGYQQSASSYGVSDILNDMRTLLGVPKYRTSKPKKVTRKFSYTRLLSPVEDLVTCRSCGSQHQASTICGSCYSKVRDLTNEIKRKMMDYNPYKGDRNDKQIFVKFNDDELDSGVVKGRRVVEMEKERPTWFRKIVRQ